MILISPPPSPLLFNRGDLGGDASPGTYVVGVVGAHGVFPVWDGATGEAPGWDAGVPGSFRDDPAFDEDGVCHVAMHPDGSRMYSTTVDAKALRAWDLRRGDGDAGTGTGGDVPGRRVWQSPKLAVRDVYLAGLAALPRPPSRRARKRLLLFSASRASASGDVRGVDDAGHVVRRAQHAAARGVG